MFKIISKKKYNELTSANTSLGLRLECAEDKLGYEITHYKAQNYKAEKQGDVLAQAMDDYVLGNLIDDYYTTDNLGFWRDGKYIEVTREELAELNEQVCGK